MTMKIRTHFTERFINMNQEVYIYDLDGTIIDSSHRVGINEDGSINLDLWRANATAENVAKDKLIMHTYQHLVDTYKAGHYVILCTARELNQPDLEYIANNNIYYDRIISRPHGNEMKDFALKKMQLSYLFQMPSIRKMRKWFFDDNKKNLLAIRELGRAFNSQVVTIDAVLFNQQKVK